MMGAERREARPSNLSYAGSAEGARNLLLRFFVGVACPLLGLAAVPPVYINTVFSVVLPVLNAV